MKPESQNLTAKESLDIITAMIQVAKGNVQRNSFFFLLWGWVVVAANLGAYILQMMDYKYPYAAWLLTIPAWLITFFKVATIRRTGRPSSHLDKINGLLWMSFALTVAIVIFFGYRINFQINPLILIFAAVPTVISGTILKFKPLIIGGIIFWVAGVVCFLVPGSIQPLVSAVGTACGYLIPGYSLRNKKI